MIYMTLQNNHLEEINLNHEEVMLCEFLKEEIRRWVCERSSSIVVSTSLERIISLLEYQLYDNLNE